LKDNPVDFAIVKKMIAGVLSARQAAQLKPVKALRAE
jgi:ABC-type lipoprotein release transport system permease subunit